MQPLKLIIQAFDNMYDVTDRKLGFGTSGCVFMAIDLFKQCQMACKVIQLRKCHENQYDNDKSAKVPDVRAQQSKAWREVDILKDLSHVRSGGAVTLDRAYLVAAQRSQGCNCPPYGLQYVCLSCIQPPTVTRDTNRAPGTSLRS